MRFHQKYRGRFAPSPTGPLHFGSLVAAVSSFLEARKNRGAWLVRMEDIDTPRVIPGADAGILRTLETFGLYWDGPVLYQSQRLSAYEDALSTLQNRGLIYPCSCTRREIADSALHGIEGPIYPGTCRKGMVASRPAQSWRVRVDDASIGFEDGLQGHLSQRLDVETGDFVIKRADGLFAYQLAVVVDDAFQGITHVVRGADLLASTPRQIHLQKLLGLTVPVYMHVPVAINAQGEKLSKQTLAMPLDRAQVSPTLVRVLAFLRQDPPAGLAQQEQAAVWEWAHAKWDVGRVSGYLRLFADCDLYT